MENLETKQNPEGEGGSGEKLEVICAWCKKYLRTETTAPGVKGGVSHGICPECLEKQRPKRQEKPVE